MTEADIIYSHALLVTEPDIIYRHALLLTEPDIIHRHALLLTEPDSIRLHANYSNEEYLRTEPNRAVHTRAIERSLSVLSPYFQPHVLYGKVTELLTGVTRYTATKCPHGTGVLFT